MTGAPSAAGLRSQFRRQHVARRVDETQFAAGDTVTVSGWPMKSGDNKALFHKVVLPDGEVRELNGNGPQVPR